MISDYQQFQDCCQWIYNEARFHYQCTFDDYSDVEIKEAIGEVIRHYAVLFKQAFHS